LPIPGSPFIKLDSRFSRIFPKVIHRIAVGFAIERPLQPSPLTQPLGLPDYRQELDRFTAANGDEILVDFHFLAIPNGPGLAVGGTWTIAGGSGRFTEATGAGTYEGAVEFTGPASALGRFAMAGTISTPGSVK
jgi:hypothetical protein